MIPFDTKSKVETVLSAKYLSMIRHRFKIIFVALLLIFSLSQCISISQAVDNQSKMSTQLSSERSTVIQYAKDLLGTSYRYGGRDERGFDCSGFTSYVLKKAGVKVSRTSRSQALEGVKVKLNKAQPGDLVFFKRSSMGKVFHVAMIVENGKDGLEVIHSTSRGVVIDNITHSKYWNPKVWAARDVLSGS